MERTPNKSQHAKLTLEKKILLPLPLGFELATFRSRVRRSNQQAIPAPLLLLLQLLLLHAPPPPLPLLLFLLPLLLILLLSQMLLVRCTAHA